MTSASEEMDPTSLPIVALAKSSLIKQIYNDVAQPAVQKVGKALGTVLDLTNTLVAPVWMLNEYVGVKKEVFVKNMLAVKDSLDKIPEDKICEVPPEIGVPIMEKLTYVTNEQIRSAYINLLSKAANEETSGMAHPAFAPIIDRLSVDEARIIEYLSDDKRVPFLEYRLVTNSGTYQVAKQFATGIEFEVKMDFAENIDIYINNLFNLGILGYTPGQSSSIDSFYTDLNLKYKEYTDGLNGLVDLHKEAAKTLVESGQGMKQVLARVEEKKGVIDVTKFGMLFMAACTDEVSQPD